MKKILLPLLLAALGYRQASAWGFFGHRTITQVAVYELPGSMQPFYYRHMGEIVRQSTAPDERRNDDPSEAPKHFIDMDHYSEDDPFSKVPQQYDKALSKFTADTIKKYGTVPWTVMTTQADLTEAFKRRDTLGIVKYSAELSHYVSDAFVPLHTTINYDGQLTNQKGLHSLWESQLPERFITDYKLNGEPAKYIKDPLAAIWEVLKQSYGFLGETFDRASKIEKVMRPEVRYTFSHRYGKTTRRFSDAFAAEYEKAVGGMVAYRLKGAPTLVASLWLTAWENGGKPDLDKLMHPNKPSKEEKEKLTAELAAWKSNTLPQSQLLLAQQKIKSTEVVEQIKAARTVSAPTEAAEPAPLEADPTPVGPDPTLNPTPVSPDPTLNAPAPAIEKVKVKTKTPAGTEKTKQKGTGAQ